MRVLVTGGAGFIGSHIVDGLLARGHEPSVLDNLSTGRRDNVPEGVPFFEADVRDAAGVRSVLERVRPRAVCHQAAQMSVSYSVRAPASDAATNVVGLLHVLEAAAHVGVRRVVFASSGGVLYGDVSEPAGEESPPRPASPYGIGKWAGEEYLRFFAREAGLEAVALRYANVYGPRQNPHGEAGVVAIFCRGLLAGEAPTINGDGRYVRDYVHVSDVARANLLALERGLPAPFTPLNIGTGRGTDVNELAARIGEFAAPRLREAGRTPPAAVHGPARPGDLRSNLVSATRARDVLGWEPEVPLDRGLRETLAWFAEEAVRARGPVPA